MAQPPGASLEAIGELRRKAGDLARGSDDPLDRSISVAMDAICAVFEPAYAGHAGRALQKLSWERGLAAHSEMMAGVSTRSISFGLVESLHFVLDRVRAMGHGRTEQEAGRQPEMSAHNHTTIPSSGQRRASMNDCTQISQQHSSTSLPPSAQRRSSMPDCAQISQHHSSTSLPPTGLRRASMPYYNQTSDQNRQSVGLPPSAQRSSSVRDYYQTSARYSPSIGHIPAQRSSSMGDYNQTPTHFPPPSIPSSAQRNSSMRDKNAVNKQASIIELSDDEDTKNPGATDGIGHDKISPRAGNESAVIDVSDDEEIQNPRATDKQMGHNDEMSSLDVDMPKPVLRQIPQQTLQMDHNDEVGMMISPRTEEVNDEKKPNALTVKCIEEAKRLWVIPSGDGNAVVKSSMPSMSSENQATQSLPIDPSPDNTRDAPITSDTQVTKSPEDSLPVDQSRDETRGAPMQSTTQVTQSLPVDPSRNDAIVESQPEPSDTQQVTQSLSIDPSLDNSNGAPMPSDTQVKQSLSFNMLLDDLVEESSSDTQVTKPLPVDQSADHTNDAPMQSDTQVNNSLPVDQSPDETRDAQNPPDVQISSQDATGPGDVEAPRDNTSGRPRTLAECLEDIEQGHEIDWENIDWFKKEEELEEPAVEMPRGAATAMEQALLGDWEEKPPVQEPEGLGPNDGGMLDGWGFFAAVMGGAAGDAGLGVNDASLLAATGLDRAVMGAAANDMLSGKKIVKPRKFKREATSMDGSQEPAKGSDSRETDPTFEPKKKKKRRKGTVSLRKSSVRIPIDQATDGYWQADMDGGAFVGIESKREPRVRQNASDLACPECDLVTRSLSTFLLHIKRVHGTLPTLFTHILRCDCGQECCSTTHAEKCPYAHFLLMRREDSKYANMEDGREHPHCVLCEARPSTIPGLIAHLATHHKTTLREAGIYIACACGVNVYARSSSWSHTAKCAGVFTVEKLAVQEDEIEMDEATPTNEAPPTNQAPPTA